MKLTSVKANLLLAASASAKIYYAGVAESGGEFGVWSSTATPGTGLPGSFGVDYAFLNASTVDIWINENKINLFRIAFLLERMCPLEYGLGSKFNETHFQYFKEAVEAVTSAGGYCILDPHNYMRYGDPSQQPMSGPVIGDASNPNASTTAQFQEFWQELATRFADNANVIFSIMNEPHDMNTSLVLENDQAAIDGIRASGATNLILAPGNAWSGGHSWLLNYGGGANSDYMYNLADPLNNTAFDIHEYLDVDFSGGHSVCSQRAPENLAGVTSWLQQYGFKAMITEFGSGNNTNCYDYIKEEIEYMANNDVYIGWTAWAAGPFWGPNSPCCSDGQQFGSFEPGSLAVDGSPGYYTTVWQEAIQPVVPAELQRSGPASVNGGPVS